MNRTAWLQERRMQAELGGMHGAILRADAIVNGSDALGGEVERRDHLTAHRLADRHDSRSALDRIGKMARHILDSVGGVEFWVSQKSQESSRSGVRSALDGRSVSVEPNALVLLSQKSSR